MSHNEVEKPVIWAFGDSYTDQFINPRTTIKEYVDYKGYVPKNYIDIISENLNLKIRNLGKGGTSNRTILSSFINVLDEIKENDILIFGWTSPNRFRIISNDLFYDVVSPIDLHLPEDYLNVYSEQTIVEISTMRMNFIFLSEISEYIKWIKKTFPNNKIINWTWCHFNEPNYPNQINFLKDFCSKLVHYGFIEDIFTETNGKVKDYHYSERGHMILAGKIIENLTSTIKLI